MKRYFRPIVHPVSPGLYASLVSSDAQYLEWFVSYRIFNPHPTSFGDLGHEKLKSLATHAKNTLQLFCRIASALVHPALMDENNDNKPLICSLAAVLSKDGIIIGVKLRLAINHSQCREIVSANVLGKTTSFDTYQQLATCYTNKVFSANNTVNDGELSPFRIFSINQSTQLSAMSDGVKDDWYIIPSESFNGDFFIENYIFPFAEAPAPNNEKAIFADLHKRSEVALSAKHFDQVVYLHPSISNTLSDLKQRIQETRELQTFDVNDAIRQFEQIIPHLGDAPKAINDFMQDNQVLSSLVRTSTYTNLSPFCNLMAGLMASFHTTLDLKASYGSVLLLYLSVLTAYKPKGFRIHSLILGPKELGKSFVMKKVLDFLIPGTYRCLTSRSKSLVPTPGLDFMINAFEEAPASMLGINYSKNGSTDTDQLSYLKNELTGGRTCYLLASNAELKDIPTTISSRFLVHQFKARPPDVMPSVDHEGIHALAKAALIFRTKVIQGFFFYMHIMIEIGLTPKVDSTVSNIIVQLVLSKGWERGLLDVSERTMTRLLYLIESLAILEFIDDYLNHHPTLSLVDLVDIKITASQEHVSLAFGLMQDCFESSTIPLVLERLAEYTFSTIIKKEKFISKFGQGYDFNDQANLSLLTLAERSLMLNQECFREGDYYSKVQLMKFRNDDDPVRSFKFWMEMNLTLDMVSSHADLEEAVDALLKRRTKTGQPILVFTKTHMKVIANEILFPPARDILRTCLSEVLCHPFAVSRDLLYGRPEKFRFPILSVVPNKDTPPLVIQNLNSNEDEIISITEALTGQPLDKENPTRTLEQDFDALANRVIQSTEGRMVYIGPPRSSQKRKDCAMLLQDPPAQKRAKI